MINKLVKATDTLVEVALIYIFAIIFGGIAYGLAEGLPLFDAIYWAGITATSTGYGDITPASDIGKVISLLLTHVSIFFIAPLVIVRLHQLVVHDENEWTHKEQEQLKAQLNRIERKLDEKA